MFKNKLPISLLDIIGPIMIGPSSSHTAGAAKIGYEAYQNLGAVPDRISIKLFNSFSDTGRGHKTDLALLGGCLGLSPEDEKIMQSENIASRQNIAYQIKWGYHSPDFHPNTAIIKLQKDNTKISLIGYSIGGGRIEIAKVKKTNLEKKSDFSKDEIENLETKYQEQNSNSETYFSLTEIKNQVKTRPQLLNLILETEEKRKEHSRRTIYQEIKHRYLIMEESIAKGLMIKKRAPDEMFGGDAYRVFRSRYNLLSKTVEDGITYAIAVGELNANMGKIVAAPTAGSAGIIPGVFYALRQKYRFSLNKMTEALLISGAFGALTAHIVELAGAVAGCQAEIGVATAMAAAGGTYLMDGNLEKMEAASSLVLANVLGLTCDPVMGKVEVPCILRNGMMASLAFTAIELSLDGLKHTIPYDEIVAVMKKVGLDMSEEYKETSQGGLAQTKTALRICKSCRACG